MKAWVCLAVASVLSLSCGFHSIPAVDPTPTPSRGMGFDVTATNIDHAVTMRLGQKLEVVLRAASGMSSWTHPASSDPSVLAPAVDPAATAAIGVTLAAFRAARPGEADVTATASPKCTPDVACPMYVALYSLRVTVGS